MAKDDASTDLPDNHYSAFLGPAIYPPPSAIVQVEFGAESRQGAARKVNEDHYLVIRLSRNQETLRTSLPEAVIRNGFEEHGYGMVVADGIGGSGAGEVASRVALATLLHLVRAFGKWNLRVDDQVAQQIMERAERFYRHVDGAMLKESALGPVPGLQTTMTACFSAGRELFFAHVGHSRAYLFRNRRLMRLTRDHSIGPQHATRLPQAPLQDVSRAARDLTHILTETLGMAGPSGPRVDIERFQLDDRDLVLVCTNGLTDAVDDATIGDVLGSERPPDDLCRALVELAVDSEVGDDVTVLAARYGIPDERREM